MSHFLPWPYARVLAHRGGGSLAPENTVAAINVGQSYGFKAVEFDAMLAADDVPVLIHDDRLERTTNGHGEVAVHPSRSLQGLDAGTWFSLQFAGEPIPLLAQALQHCRQHQVWVNLEIKPAPGQAQRTGEVVAQTTAQIYRDLMVAHGDQAQHVIPAVPLLSSFAPQALAAARRVAPDLPRGLLLTQVPADWRKQLEQLGCVSLHTNHQHLTQQLAQEIKQAGYWLFCYTVNTMERGRELLNWGVDAFCTDQIDVVPPELTADLANTRR